MRKIRFKFIGKKLACCLDIETACDYIAKEMKESFGSREILDEKLEEIYCWGLNASLGDSIPVTDGVTLVTYIPEPKTAGKKE